MKITRAHYTALAFVLAAAAVGLWAYWRLPAGAVIASHFGLDGQPDRWAPKGRVLSIVPIVSVFVIGALAFLPRVSPYSERLARSPTSYGAVLAGVAGVLFVTEAAIAGKALDPALDILRIVFMSVAVLLVVVGNLLGKLRQNNLMGVRTPWTLADERIWDKTHRFTGWGMVFGGIALAVIDLIAPTGPWLVAATVACAAGPPLVGVGYSYRLWRERQA